MLTLENEEPGLICGAVYWKPINRKTARHLRRWFCEDCLKYAEAAMTENGVFLMDLAEKRLFPLQENGQEFYTRHYRVRTVFWSARIFLFEIVDLAQAKETAGLMI